MQERNLHRSHARYAGRTGTGSGVAGISGLLGRGLGIVALVCALVAGPACVTAFAEDGSQVESDASGQSAATDAAGGADTQSFDYAGAYSAASIVDGIEDLLDGDEVGSSASDEAAVLVRNGGVLDASACIFTKTGDGSDADDCNFYGVNSVLLAVGEGSSLAVANSTVSSLADGANGVFATDGAEIYVNSVDISTESDNSRGLDATYGGSVIFAAASISTEGDHSAGAATDRGGGTVSVADASIETSGSGSPVFYSTGTIEASGVSGVADASQIASVEGLNTLLVFDSKLSSLASSATASDPVANGVILYRSTSGDADASSGEAASFQAVDSTLSSAIETGSMFYVTNTVANVILSNTVLDFDSEEVALLTVAGNDANDWGTPGSNGGTVNFTAYGQTLEGLISSDTVSAAAVYLLEGSEYTGSTAVVEFASSEDGEGDSGSARTSEESEGSDAGDEEAASQADGSDDDADAEADADDADAEAADVGDGSGSESSAETGDSDSDDGSELEYVFPEDPLSMSISSDSTWTVTDDSTLSNLYLQTGASVVDGDGLAVRIVVQAEDGAQSVVAEGESALTVTVTGIYLETDELDLSASNSLIDTTVDRSGFDEYYGTETAFGLPDADEEVEEEAADESERDEAEDETAGQGLSRWQIVAEGLKSLLESIGLTR